MIGRATIVWGSLAAAAACLLFSASYRAESLENQLAGLRDQIANEERQIRVLKAEWSFVNQPQRLKDLAQRHLLLEPAKGAQIADLSDIPTRNDMAIRVAEAAEVIPVPARKPAHAIMLAAAAASIPGKLANGQAEDRPSTPLPIGSIIVAEANPSSARTEVPPPSPQGRPTGAARAGRGASGPDSGDDRQKALAWLKNGG